MHNFTQQFSMKRNTSQPDIVMMATSFGPRNPEISWAQKASESLLKCLLEVDVFHDLVGWGISGGILDAIFPFGARVPSTMLMPRAVLTLIARSPILPYLKF